MAAEEEEGEAPPPPSFTSARIDANGLSGGKPEVIEVIGLLLEAIGAPACRKSGEVPLRGVR